MSALRNENTAHTKYPGCAEPADDDAFEDKVNRVAHALRRVLLADATRYVETIMTTYVAQSPPQYEAALHEIVRLSAGSLKTGYDVSFIARNEILDQPYGKVKLTLESLFKRANLWQSSESVDNKD